MRQPNRQLAMDIQTLLDEPLYQGRSPNFGTKVLTTVLTAIADALHRGEKVYIRGFGTLRVVERKTNPTPNNILTNAPITYAQDLRFHKPRKCVIFQPSIALMAMINTPADGVIPNHKERRTQRRWGIVHAN